ncbi:MAG: hypothetical protein HYX75_07470 [Acidobacteria bacterium]|nr:hypothetical protein [Acidobacteriota bacterium]
MRALGTFLAISLLAGHSAAAPWARVGGGAYAEEFLDMVLSPDGRRTVVGHSASISNGRSDMWMLSYSPTGKLLWQKALGLDYVEYALSIVLTPDGGSILAGRAHDEETSQSDIWVVKLDAKRKTQWQKTIGGADWDVFRQVVERPDGTLLAYGSTFSFGSGGEDMWLLSLTATGEVIWARSYGGAKDDTGWRMLLHPDGGITLVGTSGAGQNFDAWILRLRANGTVVWKKQYGGSLFDGFYDVVSTGNETCLVAGVTQSFGNGGSDGWAAEIDDAGRALWQRTYGGEAGDRFFGLVATGNDELWLTVEPSRSDPAGGTGGSWASMPTAFRLPLVRSSHGSSA